MFTPQSITLSPGQSVRVTLKPVADEAENPGLILAGSVPSWSSPSGSTGVSVTPDTDGMAATVSASATAAPGDSVVTVSGQNSATTPISGPFTVSVAEQPAISFRFVFGTPA